MATGTCKYNRGIKNPGNQHEPRKWPRILGRWTYGLKGMRGENLDTTTLVEQWLASFVPFHHVLCISMVSSDKVNTANLLHSIQNNLFKRAVIKLGKSKKKSAI